MKKAQYSMRIRTCILVCCLTFVPLDLLISFAGASYANTATQIPETLPLKDAIVPREPNSPLKLQLLREEIGAVEGKQDRRSQSESTLRQLIEQVRSVRFAPEEKQAAALAVMPAKPPAVEPNAGSFEAQPEAEDHRKDAEPNLSAEKVTSQTLEKLTNLAKQPDKLSAPLDLGEVLFSAGSLQEAATFYREALKRIDPNDPNAPNDRPWILFQIGNCLRQLDRPEAVRVYGQLVTEYPQSPWTELGKAEGKLIEWYLRDEPGKLIEERAKRGSK